MSISFNHPSNTVTSTDALSLTVLGGSVTNPKPIRLNAITAVMPKGQQPVGESGAMYFDMNSGRMKYYNGTTWIDWVDQDTLLSGIKTDLSDIINKLGTKVDTVTYSSSATPSAGISGTTLNIVFPTGQTSTGTAGLFTSLPAGSISYYSLLSGQNMASVREQMGGAVGSQNGRSGTQASPYLSKTGWCLADGNFWTWNGADGVITKQVPALNNTESYLKSAGANGLTKTDGVIAASGSIGNTSITVNQLPRHGFTVTGVTNITGSHQHNIPYNPMGWQGSSNVKDGTGRDNGTGNRVTDGAGDHQHTVTGNTNVIGNDEGHGHSLNSVDVAHFNVAVLYNIAEAAVALSQKIADMRYVLKAGDVMTGALTVASALSLNDDQNNLMFRFNTAGGVERAAIFHSTTTGTLRLRASGGPEISISNTGMLTSTGLSSTTLAVSGTATVKSKNIATSVNGSNADVNGNVTLTINNSRMIKDERGLFQDNNSGMISQWATGSPKSGEQQLQTITFPEPFPTACLSVMVTTYNTNNNPSDMYYQVVSWNATQVVVTSNGNNYGNATYPKIFAVGY